MGCSMKMVWQNELNILAQKNPWKYGQWLKPRVFFLQGVLPKYYAITFMHFIFVGRGLVNAPEHVRRYLLLHEYGHIYHQHTLPSYLYAAGAIGLAVAVGLTVEWLGLLSIAACFIAFRWLVMSSSHLAKEMQADQYAVNVMGVGQTIEAARWMADKTESDDFPERIARMSRLMRHQEDALERSHVC